MNNHPGDDKAGESMEKTITRVHSPYLSLDRLDVAVLLMTTPFLLAPSFFPASLSVLALLLLLTPPFIRYSRDERVTRPTAANLPIGLLGLVFLPLAFLLSPAPWAITWVRITTLAWSIALFFAIVNGSPIGQGRKLRALATRPTQIYLALGVLTAVIGIVGMRSVDKLFYIPQTGMLAGALGWKNGLPTNEIAGVLTLFIPFIIALIYGCWIAGNRRPLLLLLPATLLMAGTMVLSQSRTALVATAIGTVLGLLASGAIGRKRILGGLATIIVVAVVISQTPLMNRFVFAGANSWESVIGPRMGVWNQAIMGIRDHPLWGMGLGIFGPVSRLVYPLISPEFGKVLEDAHDLYLQTALDFGLAGLLVFLVIGLIVFISAIRLMREQPPRSLDRLWAAGLLGALIAHALYSLTDAVSLGTLAGIPLWFLFGLVMSAPHSNLRLSWTRNAQFAFIFSLLLVAIVAFTAYPVNRAGQLTVRALADPAAQSLETAGEISRLADSQCRAGWYEGLSFHMAGDPVGRAAAWGKLLGCTTDYTGYMSVLAAGDEELARLAITSQPEDATGYFWLAELMTQESPADAVMLYEHGLSLEPGDGQRWIALARLLQPTDEAAALNAYLQACLNGDPGANGCLNAGDLAQSRGDTQQAIEYYRLSHYPEARARADELERQLAGQ